MFDRRQELAHTVASGLDLLVDFATLGEYGIEPRSAAGSCDDRRPSATRSGRASGWEAFAQPRRGACRPRRHSGSRPRPDLELWYR